MILLDKAAEQAFRVNDGSGYRHFGGAQCSLRLRPAGV